MKFKSTLITLALALSCGGSQALDLPETTRADNFNPQQSFTELAGRQVWNYQNEMLGRIKFITADLENARLVEVVIASGGFFGLGGKLTSAPSRAFKLDETQQVMRLDVSKAQFEASPPFRTSSAAAYSDKNRVAAVMRHYGLQPWFYLEGQSYREESFVNRKLKADHGPDSRQNAEASIDSKATAMQQGANFRDVQKTNLIKQRIQADPRLSASVKNVLVITLNAQTTLRGHVNSHEERRKIGEIAMKAGRPENVSNQLEVAPARAPR